MKRFSPARRKFLKKASNVGAACSAAARLLPSFARGIAKGALQSATASRQTGPASMSIPGGRSRRSTAIFSVSFLEHLGPGPSMREFTNPGSEALPTPTDFRKDVMNEIRELGVS